MGSLAQRNDGAAVGQIGTMGAEAAPTFFLHVYPSSLYTFIDLVGEDLFRRLPIRGVLAGSEAFPLGEQAWFEQEFGIRVAHCTVIASTQHWRTAAESAAASTLYPTYGYVEFFSSETDGLRRIIASVFQPYRYSVRSILPPTTWPTLQLGPVRITSLGSAPS